MGYVTVLGSPLLLLIHFLKWLTELKSQLNLFCGFFSCLVGGFRFQACLECFGKVVKWLCKKCFGGVEKKEVIFKDIRVVVF